MNPKIYFKRSLSYFTYLLLLFLVVFEIMLAFKASTITSLDQLATSKEGILVLLIIAVLALLYPRFGFMTRRIDRNLTNRHEQLLKILNELGYVQVENRGNLLLFRPKSQWKRIRLRFEDTLIITPCSDYFIIEGVRKEVYRAILHLEALLPQENS